MREMLNVTLMSCRVTGETMQKEYQKKLVQSFYGLENKGLNKNIQNIL